jgi:hypothetical protein
MRKIIPTTFVTLDGVMQAPGAPEEDASGGFKYGGWQAHVMDDLAVSRGIVRSRMNRPGRTTTAVDAAISATSPS